MLRGTFVLFLFFVHFTQAEKTGNFDLTDTGLDPKPYTYIQKLELELNLDGKVTYENKGKPISWNIYVPSTYNPKYPPGLFLYVNSNDNGNIPDDLKAVMDKFNLIWISAHNIGSDYSSSWQVATSLEGLKMIQKKYKHDSKRVYVSGCIKLVGLMAIYEREYFKGALIIDEFTMWKRRLNNEQIRYASQFYYTILTGSENKNIKTTKDTLKQFKQNKFKNIKLIIEKGEVSGTPNAELMTKALEHTDFVANEKAKKLLRKAEFAEKYRKYGDALGLYRQIASYNNEAIKKLNKYESEINKYISLGKKAEAAKDYVKAFEVYNALIRKYGKEAEFASLKLESFKKDKKITSEIKSMSLFLKIESAIKKKVDKKKILDALAKLIETYPGTKGAKKATTLLLNYGT